MKTFDEIYNELQSENNSELHSAWKEAENANKKSKKISKTICLTIDSIALIIFLINAIKFKAWFLLFPILVPTIIINVIVFIVTSVVTGATKKYIQFSAIYKKVVIKKLMNNFYDNLEYFPNKGMPEYVYRKLQYEHYDNYKSDDYFEALINNKNSIQMADILTEEEEEYKDSDGETKTRTITKFHGLFAKIEMDKSINEKLSIMRNGGAFLSGNQLKMDSSEFEKYFDVQASNKILGMQILTADVMQELVEFVNKTNMTFDIKIENNELYLRFHSGSMFEATLNKEQALDQETIKKYFYMLNFTYNLSNKLIKVINETEI